MTETPLFDGHVRAAMLTALHTDKTIEEVTEVSLAALPHDTFDVLFQELVDAGSTITLVDLRGCLRHPEGYPGGTPLDELLRKFRLNMVQSVMLEKIGEIFRNADAAGWIDIRSVGGE